jgi:hypothetical protein
VESQGGVLRGSSSVSLLGGGTPPMEEGCLQTQYSTLYCSLPLLEASTGMASAEEDILPEVEGAVATNPEEDPYPRKKKKARCLKNLGQASSLVLGMDVKVEHAGIMAERTVVWKARGRRFRAKTLKRWATKHWSQRLKYILKTIVLTNGWFSFLFQSSKDAQWVLNNNWCFGSSPLALKL